jgi:tetratricopeptide (TPR) repeat protein
MIWTDANKTFNDAFFLMLNYDDNKELFPLWKSFSFKNHPIDDLLAAQNLLDDLIEKDTNSAKAIFLKAIVQRQLNYTEESVLHFHQAKENDYYLYPCNVYLAEYYIHKLKFDEALRYLEEVDSIYPNNQKITMLLALINIELFQFEEAKKYLNRLYQISHHKTIIKLLNHNLSIAEQIVQQTTNKLILKNFKLKSFNYNLQLKTNLVKKFNLYQDLGIPYDAVNCFIYALLLKNITAYPNFSSFNDYNVHTILNYLKIEENNILMILDDIDFDNDFVKSFEEYQEVEALMREDF